MVKRLLVLMIIFLVAGCSASNDHVCVPSSTSSDAAPIAGAAPDTAADGAKIEKLEEVEAFLKEQKIVTTIVNEIKTRLIGDGQFEGSQKIFDSIVGSTGYKSSVGAAFALFVIIYGVAVIGGLVQVTLGDAAIRLAKLGFVASIAINWSQFYNLAGTFFIGGTEDIMGFFLKEFKDLYYTENSQEFTSSMHFSIGGAGGIDSTDTTGGIFADFDIFVSRIFSPHTVALVSALASSEAGNLPAAGFLALSLVFLMMGILRTVQVYVFSIFAMALLFAIAPIFLVFILFNQTKPLFDGWLNQLISYSLQPILVSAFIGLYIGLLAPFVQDLLQYKMCYGQIGTSDTKQSWYFVYPEDNPSNERIPTSVSSEPPIPMQALLLFFIFSWMFGANVKFAIDIAAALSPSFGSDLGKSGAIWKQMQSNNPDKAGGLVESFKGTLGRM